MKNLRILWTHWFGLGRALKTIEKRWENSLLLLLPLLAFEFPWSDAENAKLKYLSWILHCPRRPCRLVLYKYRTISPTSHTHTHPQKWIWNRNRNRNRHLPSACALTRSLHSFMHSLMHLFILMSFPTTLSPPAACSNSLILIAAATLEPWQLMASEYWLKPVDSGRRRRRRRHFKLTLWLHSTLGRTWSWINYAMLVVLS